MEKVCPLHLVSFLSEIWQHSHCTPGAVINKGLASMMGLIKDYNKHWTYTNKIETIAIGFRNEVNG